MGITSAACTVWLGLAFITIMAAAAQIMAIKPSANMVLKKVTLPSFSLDTDLETKLA